MRAALMRFSVSVPVLSVQMTVVDPKVSIAERRLTSAPRRASAATPTARESVIVGSRPSGTLATIRPIAKVNESRSGSPATSQATGRKTMPAATATRAINHATRRTCSSSGLSSSIVPLRERRDPTELGAHARAVDERSSLSADAARAAEDEVACLDQRPGRVDELGRPVHRLRLAGERGEVDLERALQEACIGRDRVALLDHDHVAGHERARLDPLLPAVAHDARLHRQVAAKRLDRVLGLALLREREHGVEDDDDDDRDAEGRQPRDERQCGGDPQEEREGMRHLSRELSRPAPSASSGQLVRAVSDEAPLGLPGGEPLRCARRSRSRRSSGSRASRTSTLSLVEGLSIVMPLHRVCTRARAHRFPVPLLHPLSYGGVRSLAADDGRLGEARTEHDPVTASYAVDKRAVAQARGLIAGRQYVLDSDWGDVQPGADDENRFLETHSWGDYAEWHLGLTDGAADETREPAARSCTGTSAAATGPG